MAKGYFKLFIVSTICLIFLSACNPSTNTLNPPNNEVPANQSKEIGKNNESKATDEIEAYVVKGRALDSQGRPLAGVTIYADNQLLYNSNMAAVTDEDGYYRIELEQLAVTWNMSAQHSVEQNGKSYVFKLTPSIDQPFAGNTGAIRDFTWDNFSGELFLYSVDYFHPYDSNLAPPDPADVVLTLTPISALIDGSKGETITTRGTSFPGGFGLGNVPIGKYKVSASYEPSGQQPIQMLIRSRNSSDFESSIEIEFEPLIEFIYQVELEVKLP